MKISNNNFSKKDDLVISTDKAINNTTRINMNQNEIKNKLPKFLEETFIKEKILFYKRTIFNKFKNNIAMNNKDENTKSLFFDAIYYNVNYFNINFIRNELEKNKKIAIVYEKDFLEHVQPNKVYANPTLLNFYFFFLHNNLGGSKTNVNNNKPASFANFEYFMRYFSSNQKYFENKYKDLYNEFNGNNLVLNESIKKYNINNFFDSAKICLLYNIFLIKIHQPFSIDKINELFNYGLTSPFLRLNRSNCFFYNKNFIEPNNIFMNEILELKEKFKDNFQVINYYNTKEISQVKVNNSSEIIDTKSFCNLENFKNDFLTTSDDNTAQYFFIKFQEASNKSYADTRKLNETILHRPIPPRNLLIRTRSISIFNKIFESEKVFLPKNNKKREIKVGEVFLKYSSKHLQNKIIHENNFQLEPFLLKYSNQSFLIAEKIRLNSLNFICYKNHQSLNLNFCI